MILAIDGSYRDDGFTDKAVAVFKDEIEALGEEVEVVKLREHPIEFCRNCRECTQKPGVKPGECVLDDGMKELILKIENAKGYILASPTNFGTETAVFKRFMERLIVYAYWPWGKPAPFFRKSKLKKKKSILISSSAAPGFIAKFIFSTHGQLKMTSKTIGAEPVGTIFTGMVAKDSKSSLSKGTVRKIKAKAAALVKHVND